MLSHLSFSTASSSELRPLLFHTLKKAFAASSQACRCADADSVSRYSNTGHAVASAVVLPAGAACARHRGGTSAVERTTVRAKGRKDRITITVLLARRLFVSSSLCRL